VFYTVKKGDTLTDIAKANHQSLAELLSRNPRFWHNPDTIKPGQKVRLSGPTKKVPAKATAHPSSKPTKHTSTRAKTRTSKPTHHSTTRHTNQNSISGSGRGATAVRFALAQVGKPYVYGAEGPNAYDCSGLTQAAWRYAGVSIPRTASTQWRAGQAVSRSHMRPGDLLIINGGSHVAMYIGNGQQVEASNPRQGIGVHRLGWSGSITAVVRF
jgi:cell wall-associated NlpC family hydrolase